MIKKVYNLIFSATLLLVLFSCGGGGDDGGEPEPMMPIASPEAAALIFPENNTECNISEVLSETQSIVPFDWNASENTDTYQISIRNLNTNSVIFSPIVSVPEANITLERGTPYEWFVVSMADDTNETATSETFRFFNEGPGIENYAPFPAEAINPSRGATLAATTSVTLEWDAVDIDNDIISYEILFDTIANPTTSIGMITDTSFAVDTSPGVIYFWRIISIDSQNNTSQSEIFSFRIM